MLKAGASESRGGLGRVVVYLEFLLVAHDEEPKSQGLKQDFAALVCSLCRGGDQVVMAVKSQFFHSFWAVFLSMWL